MFGRVDILRAVRWIERIVLIVEESMGVRTGNILLLLPLTKEPHVSSWTGFPGITEPNGARHLLPFHAIRRRLIQANAEGRGVQRVPLCSVCLFANHKTVLYSARALLGICRSTSIDNHLPTSPLRSLQAANFDSNSLKSLGLISSELLPCTLNRTPILS